MPGVAVVGASSAPHKYGNKAVRAYLRRGWTVYPVNPKEKTIEGLPVYARIEDLPAGIERFTIYLPPEVGIGVLEAIKAKQPKEVYLNPGAESEALIARAEALGLEPILACSIIEIGERP
ncbi:MAG TPA: CoA-binding protein [Polyangia bacterium]|nr:CoA-binding protein [Polyangia bacterium]